MTRKDLGRTALRGAIELRRSIEIPAESPINIYDLTEKLGVEVRFVGLSSFEGMYSKSSNKILVPALRPSGRQAFACAHELGHWYFGHGSRIDISVTMDKGCTDDPEEYIANIFAGYLLAPPWAVSEVFSRLNINPEQCSPLDIYISAGQLGMGYSSLIQHLLSSLKLLSTTRANELQKISPKDIRRSLINNSKADHLLIVDGSWNSVPIDLKVGDAVILPKGVSLEGSNLTVLDSHRLGTLAEATSPGIARVEAMSGEWASFVRVSRKDFEGRSIYRHLEDSDVN